MRIALTLVLVLVAGQALAEEASVGARMHDGFFLQMQYGAGHLVTTDAEYSLLGPGPGISVRIGGSPLPNLVLLGDLMVQQANRPELERDGARIDAGAAAMSFTHFGPGVAYYFGASSFFLSGSVGIATLDLELPRSAETAVGLGLRLGLGKEWWVSEQWGIGVAGNYFTADLEGADGRALASRSFSIAFSATYH